MLSLVAHEDWVFNWRINWGATLGHKDFVAAVMVIVRSSPMAPTETRVSLGCRKP